MIVVMAQTQSRVCWSDLLPKSTVSCIVGQHVQGSPFLCQVQPGEADAASSRLYGPGLQAIQLGKPSSLFLQLADQWGNAVNADSLAGSGIKVQTCYLYM